jgi:hypothetical protein
MTERLGGRGQLSLPVVETAVGVLLVLVVLSTFAVPTPEPATREAQLDTYAADVATVLANEPPRHGDATRLSEVLASETAFDRERDALERRVDRIVPDNLMYRVRTPHGAVGFERPEGVTVGVARVPTEYGVVVVEVWYA